LIDCKQAIDSRQHQLSDMKHDSLKLQQKLDHTTGINVILRSQLQRLGQEMNLTMSSLNRIQTRRAIVKEKVQRIGHGIEQLEQLYSQRRIDIGKLRLQQADIETQAVVQKQEWEAECIRLSNSRSALLTDLKTLKIDTKHIGTHISELQQTVELLRVQGKDVQEQLELNQKKENDAKTKIQEMDYSTGSGKDARMEIDHNISQLKLHNDDFPKQVELLQAKHEAQLETARGEHAKQLSVLREQQRTQQTQHKSDIEAVFDRKLVERERAFEQQYQVKVCVL
jgi:chromosome segregation ATPase